MLFDGEKEVRDAKRMAAMWGAEVEEDRERQVGDQVTVHIPGEM